MREKRSKIQKEGQRRYTNDFEREKYDADLYATTTIPANIYKS